MQITPSFLRKPSQLKKKHILITLVLVVTLPLFILLLATNSDRRSRAAISNVLEPEAGVLTGSVSIGSDAGASGGKYINFQSPTALKPICTDKLQDKITAATAGQTITVRTDCIYRETITVNKSLTLDGQGGAEIRGSDVWTGWTQNGNIWVSALTVPKFYAHGSCSATSDGRCLWPEQVFINGTPLYQVATTSAPLAGQFNLDSNRHIVLADNPSGKTVEVTTRTTWINPGASTVTIKGFTMKHAAVDSQAGAISPKSYHDWTIANNVLSDAHGAVVSLGTGTGIKVLNNEIFRGGDLGIHGGGSNHLIQGNKIHDNNTEEFSFGWEAGGIKTAHLSNSKFDGNDVYNNTGPGIWCDISCSGSEISNNKSHNNKGIGIFFEISSGAKIYGNAVWENAWATKGNWAYGAGILISSSSNAEVYNNTVAWNADGIALISQCRAYTDSTNTTCDFTQPVNNPSNNYFHNNTIIMTPDKYDTGNDITLGFLRDLKNSDGTPYMYIFSSQANNRGDNNLYWLPQPEGSTSLRFSWENRGYGKIADFNLTPAEENGRYLSDAEKNTALTTAGIPLTPEH